MEKEVMRHPYKFDMIPVGRINVNHLYQRGEVPSVIKNIIGNFDYHLVNPIKCVYRDGNYFAFDGQNTAIALTMLFGAKYEAPVMIYNDIPTAEEEALLFEQLNDKIFRKAVSVADNIKSRLFRHEVLATDIRRIAQASGLDLSFDATKGKSGIIPASAYKTLEALYLSVGDSIFTETLSVLGGAWKYDKDAFRPQIIKGLAKFVEIYRDKYNKKALIDRLNRASAKDILNVWKISAEHGYKCIGREILAIYNKGTSVNRLPDLFA